MCGFGIDSASTRQMFTAARRLADPAELGGIRAKLPVYIAVGEMDPVNAGLALLWPLAARLDAAGLTDVTTVTYPGGRHEILNETNRAEVIAAMLAWIGRVTS
jgi:alpha-beta hydrolase superfamily lysophospholipase